MNVLVKLLIVVLTALAPPALAKNYGSYGQTWEIAEENLLNAIYTKLGEMEAAGEVEQLQKDMTARTKAYVNRPIPVPGLVRTDQPTRLVEFDPSITLTRDLKDHRGVVFARAGTRINPLDHSPFNKRIVMLDGDDPEQVAYALKKGDEQDTLLVIVNGAPLDLTKKYKRRFWFDQDGVMVKRFGIKVVPSVITRADRKPHILEVNLDE